MLTNLWWPSSSSSNRPAAAENRNGTNTLFGEDLLAASPEVDEDALVEELLTQFPTYGSRGNALQQLTLQPHQQLLQQQQAPLSAMSTTTTEQQQQQQPLLTAQEWLKLGVGLDEREEETAEYVMRGGGAVVAGRRSTATTATSTTTTTSTTTATTTTRNHASTRNNNHTTQQNRSLRTTTMTTSNRQLDEWDLEEQRLWKKPSLDFIQQKHAGSKTRTATPPLPEKQPTPQSTTTISPRRPDDNRQFWMPDKFCRHCYACETPFTVFRRRHHCRLCGQIFCNACSAYFVTTSNGNTIRVCRLCFDQVQERGGVAVEDDIYHNEDYDNDGDKKKGHDDKKGDDITAEKDPVAMVLQNPPVGWKTNAKTAALAATTTKQKSSDPFPNPDPFADTQQWNPSRSSTAAKPQSAVSTTAVAAAATHTSSSPVNTQEEKMTTTKISPILDPVKEGHRHLGRAAANHLERMAAELLRLHAPILWKSLSLSVPGKSTASSTTTRTRMATKKQWINTLLALATRCCATVDPNVKRGGDLLDIRPYCKLKVIAGGSFRDCAYLSGVLFRKTVSHKKMAQEVTNPRIMLLSGGIEFARAENHIASLDTLFEQEEKYMEILVGKILKLQPDVLLVGRSVNRRAQELLLQANVVLVQHVKSSLLQRISRQTGATIISSTDHVMNQFAGKVLGRCRRFRLVTFRDNELWSDHGSSTSDMHIDAEEEESSRAGKLVSPSGPIQRSIQAILADSDLSMPEREAALAARQLGEDVMDGAKAVRTGVAKRGVTNTYILLEGCPKALGCTVVLRGASRAALKEVKTVFRFLINVAYNLKLETSYLRERGARLRPDFEVLPQHVYSSSLAVDYGTAPGGRTVLPWNGGNADTAPPRPPDVGVTAFDHQSILVTSIWMTAQSQCCPAEVKGICYYSLQDVALGQFLRDSCFNLSLKCQNPNCKKSVLDHSLSFVHNDGLINITVEEMESSLPSTVDENRADADDATTDDEDEETNRPVATWTYCRHCAKVVTPLVFISENTWKFSFGKFLESFFYNRDAILNAPAHNCFCQLQSSSVLYFGCGKLAARFTYEPVSPYGVCVRKVLPIRLGWHRREAMRLLEIISVESSDLFVKFDKHIDKVSREARSLFRTATARPEHLQTVLSELNKVGSEVDDAAKTLQEKIASVTDSFRQTDDGAVNDTILRFPWIAKRYIFMLMISWNEKLRAAGQVISAMKKLSGVLGTTAVVGDPLQDELLEGMKRLQELNEQYARYNVTDITQSLPSLPGGNVPADGDYDDEFDDPENSMDFNDGVDADVLASRRRLKHSRPSSGSVDRVGKNSRAKSTTQQSPTKSLGTRRSGIESSGSSTADSSVNAPPKPTPGGAVKSAITRFFNRGGRDYESYVIDLGIFAEGSPRLAPGVNGEVVPVIDEQLSTIIAYSLVCPEYAKQFKQFAKSDAMVPDDELAATEGGRQGHEQSGSDKSDPQERTELPSTPRSPSPVNSESAASRDVERRMLNRKKSHIKITFRDYDEKGRVATRYVCTAYWSLQFQAVRECFLKQSEIRIGDGDGEDDNLQSDMDTEQSYIRSLSSAYSWNASGGKSGATFARTSDDRFVIKNISRTELQMFLECSSAYFEYLTKAFFHGLPTVLCKIVGVYEIGVHNRITGKRTREQVAVMQNMFYNKNITTIFDLKGSLRGRFAAQIQKSNDDTSSELPPLEKPKLSRKRSSADRWPDDSSSARDGDTNSLLDVSDNVEKGLSSSSPSTGAPGPATLLDGDFLEFTMGRPMPLTGRAKAIFQMSILNDTLFLSIINVLDYSILVGVDDDSKELVVGIIDFMRQYDILKQMERVGKSLPMVVGSEAPTIIQPPLYKSRFTNAMERYFMTVPSKWTTI